MGGGYFGKYDPRLMARRLSASLAQPPGQAMEFMQNQPEYFGLNQPAVPMPNLGDPGIAQGVNQAVGGVAGALGSPKIAEGVNAAVGGVGQMGAVLGPGTAPDFGPVIKGAGDLASQVPSVLPAGSPVQAAGDFASEIPSYLNAKDIGRGVGGVIGATPIGGALGFQPGKWSPQDIGRLAADPFGYAGKQISDWGSRQAERLGANPFFAGIAEGYREGQGPQAPGEGASQFTAQDEAEYQALQAAVYGEGTGGLPESGGAAALGPGGGGGGGGRISARVSGPATPGGPSVPGADAGSAAGGIWGLERPTPIAKPDWSDINAKIAGAEPMAPEPYSKIDQVLAALGGAASGAAGGSTVGQALAGAGAGATQARGALLSEDKAARAAHEKDMQQFFMTQAQAMSNQMTTDLGLDQYNSNALQQVLLKEADLKFNTWKAQQDFSIKNRAISASLQAASIRAAGGRGRSGRKVSGSTELGGTKWSNQMIVDGEIPGALELLEIRKNNQALENQVRTMGVKLLGTSESAMTGQLTDKGQPKRVKAAVEKVLMATGADPMFGALAMNGIPFERWPKIAQAKYAQFVQETFLPEFQDIQPYELPEE